ncbi:MAG: S-layer homology domain-containing protein [Candidatus Wallbacteria bacterium]|nr:S-layer homology domain-containing protein [Candidatus Wallbacteria bacterium]
MKRQLRWWALTAALLYAASPGHALTRDNPFSDVPKSHWAYTAVKDAVESGILEGYDNKFHGNKTLTRYQMAQIVQRMLRRMSGKKVGDLGGPVSEQDLRNLEALTIEFADELALLNVKVSTLEDNVASLKHDVEALKGSVPGVRTHKPEKRAGISGLVSVRGVLTDNNGPATGNGPFGASAGLTRYQGAVGAGGTFRDRGFFTIPQLSLGFDREVDEGIRVHTQLDYDADISHEEPAAGINVNAALPGGNGNLQINEIWIESEDVVNGWGAKLGGFALPFSDEHNGRFRTLDWTITPTAQTWRYESYRPVGIEIFTNDSLFSWNLRAGAFTGLDNQNAALFQNEFRLTGSGVNTPFSDVPQGLGVGNGLGNPDEVKSIGYYARVGDHPNEGGLGWDINYMASNGDINPTGTAGVQSTNQDFEFITGTLDYYWDWFALVAQYYTGVSKNGVAAAAAGRGIFATTADTKSTSAYILANYRWDPDNNFTARYETAEDDTAAVSRFRVNTLTVAWNRIISDHSLLQLEYLNPDATFTAPPGTATGTVDNNDRMVQANYKLVF